MNPYYKASDFVLPKPLDLAKSCYHSAVWNIQLDFTEWKNSGWTSGRRDCEERLMNAILEIRDDVHENVNIEYRDFLTQYLYLLVTCTADDQGYLLNDPEIVFMEFLTNQSSYQSFHNLDVDNRALAWLCVSSADTFRCEEGGDKHKVVNTLVLRMVGRSLAEPALPSMQTAVDALYGPLCWDLYAAGGYTDVHNTLWHMGIRVTVQSTSTEEYLPDDLGPTL